MTAKFPASIATNADLLPQFKDALRKAREA